MVAAGVASFLLLRAGYGFLVWGVLPFAASLLLVVTLGALFGRAASGSGGRRDDRGDESHPRDGV